MTPDGSRIGRQPNSVKHKTMLELASLRGKENPATPATPVTPATPITPATPVTPATPITPVTPTTNLREKEVPQIPIMNVGEKEASEMKVIYVTYSIVCCIMRRFLFLYQMIPLPM